MRLGNKDTETLFTSAARTVSEDSQAVGVNGFSTLVLHLEVSAVAGTSPTLDVRLQDSADGTNWADTGAAFTQTTAVGVKRLVANNVGRYVRAVATIGGTTPSFTFSLLAVGKA